MNGRLPLPHPEERLQARLEGCESCSEYNETVLAILRWRNVSALVLTGVTENPKNCTCGKGQRQAKRLDVDRPDWVLQELMQVEGFAYALLAIVQMN